MSEEGWKDFVRAEGVDDWVVLHGGPTAVFRTGSIVASARLASAIAEVPGLEGTRAALTVTSAHVSVRLTRELWFIEDAHIEVAREISNVAKEHGAEADRSLVQEVQVAISAKPDVIDLPFWRTVLGYDGMADDNAIDPLAHGSTVWMQDLDTAKPLRHGMHIDVSVARDHAVARVEAALAAGGRIADQSTNHWTLADRSGNKVCVTAWPDGFPDPTNPQG